MNAETLVEKIRQTLNNSALTMPEQLQELAEEFRQVCETLNRRMLTCVEHIKTGNSAEALRLAEEHPRLLDTYTRLAFEGIDDWNAAVLQFTDVVPVPLHTEHYQLISDTYGHFAPLEELFRQYRLANLQESSLDERLKILRTIAEADTSNFFWAEDVETFEKARQEELKVDIQAALAVSHQPQLAELYTEIRFQPWRVSPQKLVEQLLQPVLNSKADKLLEHGNRYEFDKAAAAYQELNRLLQTEQITAPPKVQGILRSTEQLLASVQMKKEQGMRKEHVNALKNQVETALSRRCSKTELQQLYDQLVNAVRQYNMPMPNDLLKRCNEYIAVLDEEFQKNDFRKAMRIFAAAGAFIVVVIVLFIILQSLK